MWNKIWIDKSDKGNDNYAFIRLKNYIIIKFLSDINFKYAIMSNAAMIILFGFATSDLYGRNKKDEVGENIGMCRLGWLWIQTDIEAMLS